MTKAIEARINKLSNMISKVMEIKTALTVRGIKDFTISFEGKNEEAVKKFLDFMGNNITNVSHDYDLECDMTCIWYSAK